ncbi:MAG: hypothetical protein ACNA8P_00215 [Phycisphaerales bacterium]
MRKTSPVVRVALAAGLCAMSLSLAGCITGADSRHREFLANPTPDLDTYAESRAEMDNRAATTLDTNFRMFNDDLDRLFFMDRPMRGRYPIPY